MSERRKILICISSSKWGGGERHVLDLIIGLDPYFDFTLVLEPGGDLEKHAKALGIKTEFHDFSYQNLPRLLSILRCINPDGVHTHLNQACFQVSLLRPLLTCPILATVHGFSSLLYYAFPQHLIAVSDAIKDFLTPWFTQKITRVYNGVENVKPHQPFNTPNKIPQGFIFATIHPNKGQEFVVRSLCLAESKMKITMVGRGRIDHEASLAKLIQSYSGETSLNWKPTTGDLSRFWEQADFTIIPSFREALSYVALESLTRGIPVLASATGGLREVFQHGKQGLFFDPGNTKSFLQTLTEMSLNHRRFRQILAQEPFLEQHPQFKLESMLEHTKDVYQKVFSLP